MRMLREAKVRVGSSLREVADNVLASIEQVEQGKPVEERRLAFENWQALFKVLTPKRYELLQHLHDCPEPSVRALARALSRDFKHVHEDVKALAELGLIEKDADGVRTEYDSISTAIAL